MKKLDEKKIIEIINKKRKNFVSEDVEFFKLGNETFAVSVDTLVESTDIPIGSKLSDISRKSVVSSVSDFAAKGIVPKFCIISVTFPSKINQKKVEEISKGFSKACKEFKIQLLGGDTNRGTEISIHVVLFGKVKNYVKRNSCKIGDVICTTGPFGYTGAALSIILKNKKASKKFSKKAKKMFFSPIPPLDFGIKSANLMTSSMDSSDGLSSCLNEISNQSKKKFLIENLPVKSDVIEFAKMNGVDLLKLIFNGGEEFEIVFTANPKNLKKIHNIGKNLGINIIEIGKVIKGKGVFLGDKNRSEWFELWYKGHDHFRKI
tara:strand:+ start:4019 stop:4975 length:957 start_codon:yes stop_codon:yes gene_type:complete